MYVKSSTARTYFNTKLVKIEKCVEFVLNGLVVVLAMPSAVSSLKGDSNPMCFIVQKQSLRMHRQKENLKTDFN
jgi:hypothetical protein